MSILRSNAPGLFTDAEMLSSKTLVPGLEAAQLLGVTAGRFRQMVGARGESKSPFGEPVITPGVRGGRWPLRTLLQVAVEEGRDLHQPVPSLLPRMNNQARYRYIDGYEDHASSSESAFGVPQSLWVEIYEPIHDFTCGYQNPLIALITPFADSRYVLPRVAGKIAWNILRKHGYPFSPMQREAFDPVLTVVENPQETDGTPSPWLSAVTVSFEDAQNEGGVHAAVWNKENVLATDIAACLGLPALPLWPEGTATATTIAGWSPGHPVVLPYQPKHEGLWAAMLWIREHGSGSGSASIEGLRKTLFDSLAHQQPQFDEIPAGRECAIKMVITDPGPVEGSPDKTAWFVPALDTILSDDETPPFIGDSLCEYFGDQRFSRPQTLLRSTLSGTWVDWFAQLEKSARPIASSSPRIRRLVRAAQKADPGSSLTLAETGPLHAPVVFSTDTISWLAPSGYEDEDHDHPGNTRPRGATEILLTRDGESNILAGWWSTPAGELAPIPTGAPAWSGLGATLAMLRAAAGQLDWDDIAKRVRSEEASPSLARILKTVKPSSPCKMPVSTFDELLALGSSPQSGH